MKVRFVLEVEGIDEENYKDDDGEEFSPTELVAALKNDFLDGCLNIDEDEILEVTVL